MACHIDKGDGDKKLMNFLFQYRITPSSVTGKPPCELFLGRQLRSRLDMMKPQIKIGKETPLVSKMTKYNENVKARTKGRSEVRNFVPRQKVAIVNHVGKKRWLYGIIVKKVADRSYIVNIKGRQVKRHIDDIRSRRCEANEDDSSDSWVYEYPNGTLQETNIRRPRRYPIRQRRPVDRYGITSFSY